MIIRSLKRIVKKFYLTFIFSLFTLFKVNKRRIVFSSFYGKQYSGDPKAIYELLLKLSSDYEYIWVLNDRESRVPSVYKVVSRYSLSHLYYLATAKYRIDNCQESACLKPQLGTVYLQTWHGTPFKRIAQDLGDDFCLIKRDWLLDSSYWTYLLSPSPFIGKLLGNAFKVEDNKVLNFGNPRNEVLLGSTETNKSKILKKIGVKKNKKIILYAPTFRDDELVFDLKLSFDLLKKHFSKDYVFLIRMHSNIRHIKDRGFDGDFMMDVSRYDDIQDLFVISDILITDYSSVFFDYSLMDKPMIFYPYDLTKYQEQLRGSYFEYESLVPGKIVINEEELINEIYRLQDTSALQASIGLTKIFRQKFNPTVERCTLKVLKKIGII